MGTYFHVETVCEQSLEESQVTVELDRLTKIFSTYQPDSEIAAVNSRESDMWIPVSADFLTVALQARRIFVASQGAFDPTVGGFVERWGFGPTSHSEAPAASELDAMRMQSGYRHIEIREMPPALRKNLNETRLDFSGIAKGFAVDQIAAQIGALDCENFLVDIGGEVRAEGSNERNTRWRVGIENPLDPGQIVGYLQIGTGAVATSGTYRNTRTIDGSEFSHLIDPITGRPIDHEVVLASVYSEEATTADAWATALAVAGLELSLELIDRWRLSAMLIEQDSRGNLTMHRFGEFDRAFIEP